MVFQRIGDRAIAATLATGTMVLGATRAGDGPFWLDEAYTAAVVRPSFGRLVRLLGHEAGMGPYYLALWGWNRFGESEWWLRMLSVTGGALTVAAVYLFAVRFVDRRAAAVGVAALLCNSFFLYNLTELRAYSWTMCAAVATTAAFLRLRAEPSRRRAAVYGISVGISLSLVVFSAGLVVAQLVYALPMLRQRTQRRLLLVAGAVAAAVFAPFVHALLTSPQLDWIPHTTWHWLDVQTAGAFGGTKWRLFMVVGCALLAVSLVRRRRRGAPDLALELVLLSGVAVLGLLVGLSLLKPVFLSRYLAAMFPLAALGAAAGYVRAADAVVAVRTRTRPLHALVPWALVGVCLLGVRGSPFTDIPRPEDMRSPGEFLTKVVTADEAVVFDSAQPATAFAYYFTPPSGTVVEVGWASAVLPCHVWYVARGHADQLDPVFATVPADATLATYDFVGYTIGEVDTCTIG